MLGSDPDLRRQMLVWHDGMNDWMTAGQAGFAPATASPQAAARPAQHAHGLRSPHAGRGERLRDLESQRMAGFWLRAVALVIDSVVLSAMSYGITFVIGLVIGFLLGVNGTGLTEEMLGFFALVDLFVSLALPVLYYAKLESGASQATWGKKALGLRVIREDGQPISFPLAVGRHFGRLLSGVILGVGYLLAAIGPRHQALHDMICKTYVIQD